MKVICNKINSKDFDLNFATTVFSNNFDYSFNGCGLEINKEYIVMGLAIYKDSLCMYYLIDVYGKPNWFPYLLFTISEHALPYNWFVKINEKESQGDIYFLSGFDELCNDEKYYDQLMNRDQSAMLVYFKRKIECEDKVSEM